MKILHNDFDGQLEFWLDAKENEAQFYFYRTYHNFTCTETKTLRFVCEEYKQAFDLVFSNGMFAINRVEGMFFPEGITTKIYCEEKWRTPTHSLKLKKSFTLYEL